MSYLAAFLYLVGAMGAMLYADVLRQHKPGVTIGNFAYVLAWPIIIPAIWLLAVIEAVRK